MFFAHRLAAGAHQGGASGPEIICALARRRALTLPNGHRDDVSGKEQKNVFVRNPRLGYRNVHNLEILFFRNGKPPGPPEYNVEKKTT